MTLASKNPGIIVLGLPRSGTTLLRRILNAHPRIACGGESFLLRATARFFEGDSIVDGIDYGVMGGLKAAGFSEGEIKRRVRQLAFSFLEDFAEQGGKARWASKTAVDSFYVAEIERLYAGHAQFVCVLRHALDATLSLNDLCEANEIFIAELHRYVARCARPLEAYAHAWNDVTGMLLEFARRNRKDAMIIRYEDLVKEPSPVCEQLFEFLGEPWDDDMLASALSDGSVTGLGDWKTYSRRSIDNSSVDRWKSLREDIVSRLGSIVNPVLESAGYEPVPVAALPDHDEAMHRYELSMRFNVARAQSGQDD